MPQRYSNRRHHGMKLQKNQRTMVRKPSRNRRASAGIRYEWLEPRAMLTALWVTSNADAGAGTFRDAVQQANVDSDVRVIRFASDLASIQVDSPVTYTGAQSLAIDGRGGTLEAGENTGNLLESTGGANLFLKRLTIQNGLQSGVHIPIPPDASGEVSVTLKQVVLKDNALHGLHVDDQSDPDDPDEVPANSAASLRVEIWDSEAVRNALADVEDVDGIRVDEGGEGSVAVRLHRSSFVENGGDGVEVDEQGDGDVMIRVRHSEFLRNGHKDGGDREDGFDVDEAGEGAFWARLVDSQFNDSADQGVDFDEEGPGNMDVLAFDVAANENGREGFRADEKVDDDGNGDGDMNVVMSRVELNGNGREGTEITEEANGNFRAALRHVVANGNAREGLKIEELIGDEDDGSGNLTVVLRDVVANENLNQGVQIYEEGPGNVVAALHDIVANSNGEVSDDPEIEPEDGVRISEFGGGDLIASARKLTANQNTGYGLVVEQEAVDEDDDGRLKLRQATLVNNLLGDILRVNV